MAKKTPSQEFDERVYQCIEFNRYVGINRRQLKQCLGVRTNPRVDASLRRMKAANQIIYVGTRWLLHPDRFRQAKGRALRPEFTASDFWILMSIRNAGVQPPLSIRDILPMADLINKALPNVDELHGALNRLQTARLISCRNGRFKLSTQGEALFEKFEAVCVPGKCNYLLDALGHLVKCPCCGIQLTHVRWRIDVTEEQLDEACRDYVKWFAQRMEEERQRD